MQGPRSYDSHVLNIMLFRKGMEGREVFGFHLWALRTCAESKQKVAEIDRWDGDLKQGVCADNQLTAIFIFNTVSSPAAHLLLCSWSPLGVYVCVCACVF